MWAVPTTARPAGGDIAYVATREDSVRDMLWTAKVSTNDGVYDLGSGDGRVVIARQGQEALSLRLLPLSRFTTQANGSKKRKRDVSRKSAGTLHWILFSARG